MKRKHKLSIISAMIVITMLCSFLVLPVNATTEVKSAALEKIDTALSKRLEAMNDTEAISVSVWFKDIDRSELKERVESEIKNNLSRGLSASQKAVDLVFLDESETKSVDELSNLIEAYSDVTTEDVQAVITLKRDISAQMHQQNNMSIIERVLPGISTAIASKANTEYADGASIQYVCKYAPNADMYLTKSQIYDLANNSDIVEINYRSTNMIDLGTNETSLLNTDKLRSSTDYDLRFLGVLGLDHARDVWGLSGNGMHIGIVESTNTVNFNLFTNGKVDNIDDWNPNGDSHGTQIASLMLGEKRTGNVVEYPGAIPNAVVHVTKTYGSVANLKGAVERLIGVGNLNVISSSVGAFVNGENGAYYSDEAKWYDYVSTHYNIHLALCAGNYYPNLGPFEVVHSNNSYNAVVVGNCDTKVRGPL